MLSMTIDIFTVIPLIFKMLRLHVEGIAKNQVAVNDPLRKWMDNCYRGVPLSGLGKHREKLPRVLSAVSNIPQDL